MDLQTFFLVLLHKDLLKIKHFYKGKQLYIIIKIKMIYE